MINFLWVLIIAGVAVIIATYLSDGGHGGDGMGLV